MSGALPSFDLRLVPSFQAVAEERNFGRAADRLRIAQPALSRQIAKLEEQLGTPLLVRGSREVTPTPAGQMFLAACRDITGSAARAQASARAHLRQGLVAHVGLGMPADLIATLRAYGDTHPEVGLDLLEGPSSSVDAVLAREADVGFEVAEGVPLDLDYLPLRRSRAGVVCAPDHPLALAERAAWTDLEGETVFLGPAGPGDGYNEFLRSHLRMFGADVELVHHSAPELDALLLTISSSRGVVITTDGFLESAVAAGRVVWVLLTPLAEIEHGLVWDPRRTDPGVDRFVRWAAGTMSSLT